MVDGFAVLQGHDAQVAAQFLDSDPVPDSAVPGLDFAADGFAQRPFKPFWLQVGALDQDVVAKVVRRLHGLRTYLPHESRSPVTRLNTSLPPATCSTRSATKKPWRSN